MSILSLIGALTVDEFRVTQGYNPSDTKRTEDLVMYTKEQRGKYVQPELNDNAVWVDFMNVDRELPRNEQKLFMARW